MGIGPNPYFQNKKNWKYDFVIFNQIHKNDETIFFSEINRVQITGKKIINKKLIPRFCSSTKREFRIYNTKEKLRIQNEKIEEEKKLKEIENKAKEAQKKNYYT